MRGMIAARRAGTSGTVRRFYGEEQALCNTMIAVRTFCAFALVISWSWPTLAQDSPTAPTTGLLVSPTYVLFDGHVRSQALLLSNRGVTPETYRISIVNRLQKADGQLVDAAQPADGEGFAAPLVRYAPREILLPPDKPQTVRLLLQMPANLPDGEYRSHILFQQIPTETASESLPDQGAGGLSVTIRAVFGVTIPLIVRKGKLEASASLSDLHLIRLSDNQPALALRLNRSGTRSLHGDLTVQADNTQVGFLKNVNVFLSTPYRELAIPLSATGDLTGHRIAVKFTEDEEKPGAASTLQTLAP